MPRRLCILLAMLLASTAYAAPHRLEVCTMIRPGIASAAPYYRACRPIPKACAATPTCACLARHGEPNLRYGCHRKGWRFIRGSVGLP